MTIEPQGGGYGAPRRRPDLEEAWPILGALVTFIVTWQLTQDLGIALAAASVSWLRSRTDGTQSGLTASL